MKFSERLKALRTQASLTQKQLGEAIGVSSMTIRNWESGAKLPSMQAIISLTDALNTSADVILGTEPHEFAYQPMTRAEATLISNYRTLDKHGQELVATVCALEKSRIAQTKHSDNVVALDTHRQRTPARYIPKYTTPSAAGYSAPLDGEDFEMLLVDDSVPEEADFAVEIQGNSMEPYICDSDTVFVKRTSELDVGDVGIFNVDGAMYCKIYYIDEGRNLTLVSANPALADSNVHIDADSGSSVVCFGKVLLDKCVPFPDYFERT